MCKLQTAYVALLAVVSGAAAQCNSLSSTFDNSVTGPVHAMTEWSVTPGGPHRLVVGGTFRVDANDPARFPCDFVGYWDGAAWRSMGWGTDGAVEALTIWTPPGGSSPQVVAAGLFQHVGADSTGEVAAANIARYDGTRWHSLASGLDGRVRALTTWDPDGNGAQSPLLIAAGEFRFAGATWVDYIAAWDGVVWRALGWGFNAPALTLTTWDPDGEGTAREVLVAGGAFSEVGADGTGALTAHRVAAWNGTSWLPISVDPAGARVVTHLATFDFDGDGPDSEVLVAIYGGLVQRWDGASWFPVGPTPLPNHGGTYKALVVLQGDTTSGRLWFSADTWYWWWSYGLPDCVEGCPHFEVGPTLIWSQNSLGQPAGDVELNASVLGGWDPDGNGPLPSRVVAAGSFPGFIQAHTYQTAPVIVQQPQSAHAPVGGSAAFMCLVESPNALSGSWFKASRPAGTFVQLTDGVQSSGSTVVGASTPTLAISNIMFEDGQTEAPLNGDFRATFYFRGVNNCGSVQSDFAVLQIAPCSADFDSDGDSGTDADIEAFFGCLSGACCGTCSSADFNGDGDVGTDADIEAFFRVLGGGAC
jgi:hypothetical protein